MLLSGNCNKYPRDKTKWYSINELALKKLEKSGATNGENGEKPVKSMVSPITPNWGNALEQNGVMQNINLGQPLPEISTEISTEISKSQSVSHRDDEIINKKESQSIGTTTDRQTDFDRTKVFFEDKLCFDDLKVSHEFDKKLIEEIELNILEMYFNDYTTIKGARKPREIVRSALMKHTYWHIEELLNKYKNLTMKITNPKAYMQTMIYNIAFESDLAVTNQVQHDISTDY